MAKDTAKTTFKVRQKRWAFFNKECEALFIKRDAFLNHVLLQELNYLQEIAPCDDEGAKWLKENWRTHTSLLTSNESEYLDISISTFEKPDTSTENTAISLSEETIHTLNKVCEEKKIPRDAFFNLMLEFLSLRILDCARVIKNPRDNRDFIGRMSVLLKEASSSLPEDISEANYNETISQWKNDVAKDLCDEKALLLQIVQEDNLYQRLTFTKEKVAVFKEFFEDGL